MPQLSASTSSRMPSGTRHVDWNHVNHKLDIMTILRDPVERTLSEFFFIRTDDGKKCSRQNQWNFNNDTWLQYVQNERNVDDALKVYLNGYPRNPSINRQSMYLLGFDKQKQAGEKYEWKQNHGSLVAQVKAHLDNTTVFGITDCYEESMQVIAEKLGWPVDETLKIAREQWSRRQDKPQASLSLQRRKPLTPMKSVNLQNSKWRDAVHPEVIQLIQEQNAVDMELFNYARQRFGERFGMAC